MIQDGRDLKMGDIIYPIEIPDNRAVVLRSNEWWTDILWDDGSNGKIEPRNLKEFDKTGNNIEKIINYLIDNIK